MSYFIRNLGPVDTYPNIYENGDFFLRFSILSTREQRFQAPETQVFENGPQSGAFSESPAYTVNTNTNTVMSYMIQRMLC